MKVLVITFIALLIVGILASFYYVDKPRKPITFVTATLGAAVNVITIWLLWRAYL